MSAEMPKMPEPVACKHIQDCTTPKLCLSVGTCKGYYVMPASVRESANKAHPEPGREAFEAFCTKRWGGSSRDMFDIREDGEYFNGRVQFAWSSWQEAARQAMERECEWTRDSDFESEVWNTACGNAFIFTDGGPAENDAKFCCYCGGKLRALIPQSEKRHG